MESLFKDIFNSYRTDIYRPFNEVGGESQNFYSVTPDGSKWFFNGKHEDDESYLENYGNICSNVNHRRITVVLERDENKVSLKVFKLEKNRRLTKRFFRKNTSVQFITYRISDSAVFYGTITDYHKKRKSRKYLRRFVFGQKDIIMELRSELRYVYDEFRISKGSSLMEDGSKPIKEFINVVSGGKGDDSETFYKTILEKQGVKYPNNIMAFVDSQYPTVNKKSREVFDGKYVDTFMGLRGYVGKKIKRVLHTVDSFNEGVYKSFCDLFGEDYVLKTSTDDELKGIFQCGVFNNFFVRKRLGLDFTDLEKNNFFKICILSTKGFINSGDIMDHLNFYFKINKFEKCRWTSSGINQFTTEHMEWSDKVSSYNNGNFCRVYGEEFVKQVECVIKGVETDFIPTILKNSEEYNEESLIQSNCVRTYIKRPDSLIISLRGINENYGRATIEYKVRFNGKTLELTRTQTLGRFNQGLDEYWGYVINILDDRVYDIVKDGLFTEIGVEVEFNGTNIKSGYKVNEVMVSQILPINNGNSMSNYKIEWDNDKVSTIGDKNAGLGNYHFDMVGDDIDIGF